MNIYKIENSKFKSIYLSYNFTVQAKKEDISYYNVLASVLSKSSNDFETQKKIEEYLYSLYGANFDVNVEKIGDLFNIEFKIEFINYNYLPKKEDILDKCLEFIYSIIYNPIILNTNVNNELIEREKENIIQKILTRKDDKLKYAVNRTEEILCENSTFGTFIYGNEKIVEKIKIDDLRKYYYKMLNESIITIIISGNLNGYNDIESRINQKFNNIKNRNVSYKDYKFNDSQNSSNLDKEIKEVKETADTTQSVITMGMKIENFKEKDFYALNLYNGILGATPSSKLFQNFREKESLAYTVRSRYYRYKNMIIIYAGIDLANYDTAKEVLIREINDMNQGNISQQEFEAAKESLIADLLDLKDSKIALAKMLMSNLFFYYNDKVDVQEMVEKIKSITLEQVIQVSNKLKIELFYLLGGEVNE